MSKILVYLEANDKQLKRTSYEAITAAMSLTSADNVLGVIINGNADAINSVGNFGLANVINVKSDSLSNYSVTGVATAIKEVVNVNGVSTILFGSNATGKELAPRVAVKLSAGYISDCVGLAQNGGNITATKPVYAGKAEVSCEVTSNIKVFSLRPNVFTAKESSAANVISTDFTPNISTDNLKVKVKSVVRNEGKLDVAEADKIVTGGRGLKGPENFNIVEDLAKAIGGAVGASRAVVDAGWRPHGEQVGQTGKTVSPNLYVALAVSGAVQHLAGMSGSKIIVAINKDKDAPIFKVADYGIVGDVFDVVPKLTTQIKAMA